MKTTSSFWHGMQAVTASVLVLGLVSACKPKVVPSGPLKATVAKTNAPVAATNLVAAQDISGFVEMMPPKGRDPFFPNSHRRDPAPLPTAVAEKAPAADTVVLKGIVGSSVHRLAVIGGGKSSLPMEVGDSATIRVPGGQVRVTCLEVGEDYAVIQVEGEPQPKRLPLKVK